MKYWRMMKNKFLEKRSMMRINMDMIGKWSKSRWRKIRKIIIKIMKVLMKKMKSITTMMKTMMRTLWKIIKRSMLMIVKHRYHLKNMIICYGKESKNYWIVGKTNQMKNHSPITEIFLQSHNNNNKIIDSNCNNSSSMCSNNKANNNTKNSKKKNRIFSNLCETKK